MTGRIRIGSIGNDRLEVVIEALDADGSRHSRHAAILDKGEVFLLHRQLSEWLGM